MKPLAVPPFVGTPQEAFHIGRRSRNA